MSPAMASSPLRKSEHMIENVEVSNNQGLPPASPTMSAASHLSPVKVVKINEGGDFNFEAKRAARIAQVAEEIRKGRADSDSLRREAMRMDSDSLRRRAMSTEGQKTVQSQTGAGVVATRAVEEREDARQHEALVETAEFDQHNESTAHHSASRAQIKEQKRSQQVAKSSGINLEEGGQKRRRIHRQGLVRLEGKRKKHTSLDEDLAQQERRRWKADGAELWGHESNQREPAAEFSGPAPPLPGLVEGHRERLRILWLHRERVRCLRDENRDGTRNWSRVQLASEEKKSEDQKAWFEYGDRVSFGSYGGEHSNEEAQQRLLNSTRARAGQFWEQQRTNITTLEDGDLKKTNLAEAQEMTSVPKIENGAELYHVSDDFKVQQAEIYASLTSVGLRPHLVEVAPASQVVSEQTAFHHQGAPYNNDGYKIQPVPTKRSMQRDAMIDMDGPVPPWPIETAAEPRATPQPGESQAGTTSGRGRVARGRATTRGRGGMGRGGENTNGRTPTRGGFEPTGGCQTALPQQALTGQYQGSPHPQGPSASSMRGSSVMTGQNSHEGYLQEGEMQKPSIIHGQQRTGTTNGHVHANETSQRRPSGFMPTTMIVPSPYEIPETQIQGPQQQRPVSTQWPQNATISSQGPIQGTSYGFPHLECGWMMAAPPQNRGSQQAFPLPAQRPSRMPCMSKSPWQHLQPPPVCPYGEGQHEGYYMQRAMPQSSRSGPQEQLPSPSQGAVMPRAMPPLAGNGPQQHFASPSQRPAYLQSPTAAPAHWPRVQAPHNESRAGNQGRQLTQSTIPAPVERGVPTSPIV